MKSALLILCLLAVGCREKPTVKAITTVPEMEGTWVVVEATDPSGNGYEADSVEMVITGNKATCLNKTLRLEPNADSTYIRLFETINGVEKQVGEVAVEMTIEANPPQMVWMDVANTKQVTLFQRKQ